jgi:drug/metabolite transporter (DMT)-like permease
VTAAAALLLAILIWASNSIMVKVVLREIEPLTLTWLRFLLAALFYVPYAAATRRRAPRYTPREWALLLVAGVALVPAFSLTLYWALSYTTVANTALVRMTEPAWVLLLAALLLGERATRRQVAAA